MFSVEGTVNFEPVVFSIHSGSEDSEEGSDSEFQVSVRLTEKEFCESVESSGRSWEETYEILLNYHQKLLNRGDELHRDIVEKEEKLKQLKARKKYVDKIRSQISDTMRYIQRKMMQTSKAVLEKEKIIAEKQKHKEELMKHLEGVLMRSKEWISVAGLARTELTRSVYVCFNNDLQTISIMYTDFCNNKNK
ncbi:hypothetical protein AOXY_G26145 [Acipenser oxyrinchus oxyrinchus]|uniref:Uncharacterized protein n=1 Tax=Acipenser oxyrinchus oxyrinchus TaxID=40147 RepID=A0AAD8CSJ9_ACIOX|nr:hypothetical protein AOXY_G26145 [Acipenser oxyrinchus oxyrinchus]